MDFVELCCAVFDFLANEMCQIPCSLCISTLSFHQFSKFPGLFVEWVDLFQHMAKVRTNEREGLIGKWDRELKSSSGGLGYFLSPQIFVRQREEGKHKLRLKKGSGKELNLVLNIAHQQFIIFCTNLHKIS